MFLSVKWGAHVCFKTPLSNETTLSPRCFSTEVPCLFSGLQNSNSNNNNKKSREGCFSLAWSRRVNLDYGNYQLLRKIYYRQGRYYILLCGEERYRNAFRGTKKGGGVRNKWKFVVGRYECLNDEWPPWLFLMICVASVYKFGQHEFIRISPKKVFQCGPINFWQMKWNIKSDFSALFQFPPLGNQ